VHGSFPAGKHVKVEPLAAVVTLHLQQLLKAVLAMVQASNGSSTAAGGGRPPSPGELGPAG
jgi:hypothetical protein